VRGARVDHAGVGVRDQRRRLARGGVGQAQECDIGGVEQAGAFCRVLAQLGRNAQHLDVGTLGEILVDAQAGRAFLAVDDTRCFISTISNRSERKIKHPPCPSVRQSHSMCCCCRVGSTPARPIGKAVGKRCTATGASTKPTGCGRAVRLEARLDEVVLDSRGPLLLAAHSLGCQLVASWAAHSRHTSRVRAALLVAPPDTERDDMPPNLFSWRPIVRSPLPFASLAILSSDDPYCSQARATAMARGLGLPHARPRPAWPHQR
jgi:hypothetical protein